MLVSARQEEDLTAGHTMVPGHDIRRDGLNHALQNMETREFTTSTLFADSTGYTNGEADCDSQPRRLTAT